MTPRTNEALSFQDVPTHTTTEDPAVKQILDLYYSYDRNDSEQHQQVQQLFALNKKTIHQQHVKKAAEIIATRFNNINSNIQKKQPTTSAEKSEWLRFLNFGLEPFKHRTDNPSFFQHKITLGWSTYATIMAFITIGVTEGNNTLTTLLNTNEPLQLTHRANDGRKQYERTRTLLTACLKKNLRKTYVSLLRALPPHDIDQALRNNNDELRRYLFLDDSLGLFTLLYAAKAYAERRNLRHLSEKINELASSSQEKLQNVLNDREIPNHIRNLFPYLGQREVSLKDFYWESGVTLFLQQETEQENLAYTSYKHFSEIFLLCNMETKLQRMDPRIITQFAIKHYDHQASHPNPIIFNYLGTEVRLQLARRHLTFLIEPLMRLISDEESGEYLKKKSLKQIFSDFRSTYLSWVFLISTQFSFYKNSVAPLFRHTFNMDLIQETIRPLLQHNSPKDLETFNHLEQLDYKGVYWGIRFPQSEQTTMHGLLHPALCQLTNQETKKHALYQQIASPTSVKKLSPSHHTISPIEPMLPTGTMYKKNNPDTNPAPEHITHEI